MKEILVVGGGYVGLSNAVLLAQKSNVTLLDICKSRVDAINNKKSPIKDEYIESFFKEKKLSLVAVNDQSECALEYNLVVIALPTNYDEKTNYFNTSIIDGFLNFLSKKENFSNALIVIKSTIPLGYVVEVQKKFLNLNIVFSPEFLREGKALYDNLYPSRIVVGGNDDKAKEYARIMKELSLNEDVPVFHMNPLEAEAVKLFANTYLAVRIAFFNELDTYACKNNLHTRDIIDAVCADSRIGDGYNNPSFGYGGYCLPKDTKQLLSNYNEIPNAIIEAVISSNEKRKEYIFDKIMRTKSHSIGIYRLSMKTGSDNLREAPILDIMRKLYDYGKNIIIYETSASMILNDGREYIYETELESFKENSDIILANRFDVELDDVAEKVYTRDIYFRD